MAKSSTPAVVIGAGPYGLSAAAHLRGHGVPTRVFGDVMSSWRHHMPVGMKLKSPPHGSDLSAPAPGFGLADFSRASGQAPLTGHGVIPIELFVAYGQWFQERWVPDLEPEQVTHLDRAGGRFHVTLSSGEEFDAATVVMASGLNGYAHVPPELAAIAPDGPSPDGLVSHTSQHPDLSVFRGQEVAVIGAGQSALESAALLHEAGAGAQVLVRGQARWGIPPNPPRQGIWHLIPEANSPLGSTWRIYPFSHAPAAFRFLPVETRLRLVKRVLGPLGAWWLKDRVVGQLPVLDGHRIVAAQRAGLRGWPAGDRGRPRARRHRLPGRPGPPGLSGSRSGGPGPAGGRLGLPRPFHVVRVLGAWAVLHQPDRGRELRAGHAIRGRGWLRRAPGGCGRRRPDRIA
jgi:cation diffusion facilitator CzcD-associated flavoprotein CzcO